MRGLLIGSLFLAILLIILQLQPVIEILLVLFAGVLLGILLSSIIFFLEHRTPLSHRWAVGLVLLFFAGLLIGSGLLIGPPLAEEMNRLYDRLDQGIEQIHNQIKDAKWLQPFIPKKLDSTTLSSSSSKVLGGITTFLSTSLGILANAIIVLFIGIYLAVNPTFYIKNGIHIFPPEKRERAYDVLTALGRALAWWLYGRLATMAAVGILTAVCLLLIGLPLAMTLGFIAGLLAFVPYIGPVVSVIPAVLVALAEGNSMVGSVLLVYLIVQTLESYLLTPLIQKKAVSIPPALLISVQVFLGVLIGSIGVMLATPLAVSVIVLIQLLYLEDVLGESVTVIGER